MSKEPQERGYRIMPSDIDPDRSFRGLFGKLETEQTARTLIAYWRRCGGWDPASEADLAGFLNVRSDVGIDFLIAGGFIVHGGDGKFRATEAFILRCYGEDR